MKTWISAGLAAVLLVPGAAQAQTGGWTASRDEYNCYSVSRTQGAQTVRLLPATQTEPAAVSISLPVELQDGADGRFSKVRPRGSRYPTHSAGVSYSEDPERSQPFSKKYRADIRISGDAAAIDWLANASPSFDVTHFDKPLLTVTATGIAEARAALAACRPVAPPPNRALRPQGNRAQWIDANALLALVGDQPLGPIAADLLVNARGRVERCTVTQSSGRETVDQRFCSMLRSRGRFTAATDALGKHIAVTCNYRVGGVSLN